MPFELGLTVALAAGGKHSWVVCETIPHRIQKSLSDLNGTDVYVHGGTIEGVFGEMCNAFVRTRRQPTVVQMRVVYRAMRRSLGGIQRAAGTSDLYKARVFQELCVVASEAADRVVG